MQPGWIFRWPGIAFSQGAVQTCRELWLVQPSLELLVWQLCPWEVYRRIILKLFDFFAALLWELSVFGFACSACSELVLLVPLSWCSDISGLCMIDNRAVQTFPALSSSPGGRYTEAVLVWSNTEPWSRAFAWNLCSPQFADETCLLLQAYLWCQRSLSASGCVEVRQWQDSRAREQSAAGTCGVYCCWRS